MQADAAQAEEFAELVRWLGEQYERVRVLPDGSIACLSRLMFTTGIFLGVTRWSWERRFCFDDRSLALLRFEQLQSDNDEPQGYIARR